MLPLPDFWITQLNYIGLYSIVALGLVLLTGAGLLTAATALPGAVAMAASFAGMFIGQAVRTRLQPDIFRRWFQIGMIVLGLYLASNALAKLMA